jgi:hypothetical protein
MDKHRPSIGVPTLEHLQRATTPGQHQMLA